MILDAPLTNPGGEFSDPNTEYMNQLAEEFTLEFDTQDLRVVSAETPQVSPPIREAFAGIDSYPTHRAGLLSDRDDQAPRLTARQAPYFMD
jgi:hypothetical protein